MHGEGAPAEPPATTLQRGWHVAITVLALVLAGFHVYTAYAGPFYALAQRAFHVGLATALVFLVSRPRAHRTRRTLVADGLMALVALGITAYVIVHRFRILRELGYADPTSLDTALGYGMVVLLLVASWRVIGWEFAALTVAFLAYGMVGPWLPGVFEHQGFTLKTLIDTSFLNPMGMYGGLTAVSATVIATYVLFGSILLATGGASAFLNLALIAAGRVRGGAAQVAVISSGIMGMINGSAVANVATTGAMTIPMMKRQGYPAQFAGAVEAAAASGGQIMPPIMGAGAFVMAEILGIPYLKIAKMGAIPAVLYYAVIAATVYFEACKRGLRPVASREIPRLRDTGREILVLVIPLAALSYFLFMLYTPRYAGFWAIATCLTVYFGFRLLHDRDLPIGARASDGVRRVVDGCRDGASTAAVIGVLVAGSQIMVAVMGLTGIGLKFSELIFSAAGGNVFLGFVIAAVISLILGTGLPTVPSYIITVAVVGPALEKMGVEPIVIHMFSFYYACMSGLTPPVAGTSFVAAGLAKANVWSTSWESCRLAMAGFLVPFLFAFHPQIFGIGSLVDIALAVVFGVFGCVLLAAALARHWIYPLVWWQQILLAAAGMLAMTPGLLTDLLGVGLAAVTVLLPRALRGAVLGPSAPPVAATVLDAGTGAVRRSGPSTSREKG
jgi:TRAP transporter 4TM/12TM fusion protein